MNSEQLQKTRQEHWRQDGNALLTLEDAEQWINEQQLCLFLPRRAHLPVPAPSFAEAVGGRSDATPAAETLAQATQLMARLVESGAAVPLNLFGTPGEHPDFLATPEALMFLYALQGERNPKHGPQSSGSGRVSPLAVEVWKVLEREGALTADELRERVGRETTEAAVLRALSELWHGLRVAPVPGENGEPAHWEPLSARHRKAITSGSTQSQTTALSMLVSYYLRSAIIATGEEIELFLSPVTSRSRVRDVLRGLSANRQLGTLPLGTQMHFYVEGTLPEFAEEEIVDVRVDAGLEGNEPDVSELGGEMTTRAAAGGSEERRHAPQPSHGAPPARPPRRSAAERPASGARPSFAQRAKRPSFGERSKRPFGAHSGAREASTGERPSRPYRDAAKGSTGSAPRGERGGAPGRSAPRRGGFGAKKREGAGAASPRPFGAAGPFKPGRAAKPFSKPGGAPFDRRETGSGSQGGPRPPFRAARDRPQRPEFARGEAGGAKFGGARSGSSRSGSGESRGPQRRDGSAGERRKNQTGPRSFERRAGPGRAGERPPQRRGAAGPFGGRAERPGRPSGERGGERSRFKPRTPRAGSDRPPFPRRDDRAPAGARGDARTFKPRNAEGSRPPRGEGSLPPRPQGGFAKGAGSGRPFDKNRGEDRSRGARPGSDSRSSARAFGRFRPRTEAAGPRSSGAGGPRSAAGPGRTSGGAAKRGFGGPKRTGFKPGGGKSGGFKSSGPRSGGGKPGGFKSSGAGGFSPPKRRGPRRPEDGGAA